MWARVCRILTLCARVFLSDLYIYARRYKIGVCVTRWETDGRSRTSRWKTEEFFWSSRTKPRASVSWWQWHPMHSITMLIHWIKSKHRDDKNPSSVPFRDDLEQSDLWQTVYQSGSGYHEYDVLSLKIIMMGLFHYTIWQKTETCS